MIRKKRIIPFIYFLMVKIILVSCVDYGNKTNTILNHSITDTQKKEEANSENFDFNDISNIKLTLSRGAFHWDSFQLIGNKLTYLPSKENDFEGYPEYQKKSKVILSDSIVKSLIKEIVENDILQLDTYYDNMTSCGSMLEVVIKINTIEKKISCKDFEKGCPEILTNLEKKLIALHGKNLKRIFLPG
ncbi:hypothetical protein ATE84_3472 [Aquimarina sp. MAR_2010_214]|uniref:hypothetical protein n=1 Tax=Aquimarina sp. MAR_2010_214 TaxID=1250026 RepID=UPI000C70DEA7|nr:hypothetical protein [Aquimarina sp. MAR_2010_214]PKV51387.1 hypothetical protein ATE84_3472 [Aquimarina sp. MAR_2010_214]